MTALCSRAIAQMFAEPVDPARDDCGDYFDVISHPMDLHTVRDKLENGQYSSVSEWKSDVNLIWSNSNQYNGRSSILGLITKDLSDLFHKLSSTFSDSPQTDWNEELQLMGNEMAAVTKDISTPTKPAIEQARAKGKRDSSDSDYLLDMRIESE
jgi:hypothetical protein